MNQASLLNVATNKVLKGIVFIAFLAITHLCHAGNNDVDLRGLILSINGSELSINVNGTIVTTDDLTDFDSDLNASFGFDDLRVGMQVDVRGQQQLGSVLAERVKLREPGSGGRGGGANRFRGVITEINTTSNTLAVNGLVVQVTEYTGIFNLLSQPIPFSDLEAGQIVDIGGSPLDDGRILAGKIERERDLRGGGLTFNLKFKGRIESIDPIAMSMVINGRDVLTTMTTKFEDAGENHVTFDFFQVGQFVEVKANQDDNGIITAVAIEIDDDGATENEFEFKGIIDSIDLTSRTLIVNGTLVMTHGSTRLLNRFNQPIEFERFESGQFVEVEGNKQDDGSILARKVKLEDLDNGELPIDEVAVRGTISAIDYTSKTLVVEGQTIHATATTRLLGLQNQSVNFNHFEIGHLVEVEGVPAADSDAINATKIKREDGPAGGRIRVRGSIVRPSQLVINKVTPATVLSVGSWEVTVDGSATVNDRFGQPISVDALALGDYIVANGTANGARQMTADALDREDLFFQSITVQGVTVDLRGLILSINGPEQSINVNGTIVATDGMTDFDSDLNASFGFDDLRVGMQVDIRGQQQTGSVLAERVQLREAGSGKRGGGTNRFRGVINAINSTSQTLTVNGVVVQVTDHTGIFNLEGVPMSFGDLRTGQIVDIGGTPLDDGRMLAGKIERERDLRGGGLTFNLKFKGQIESIDPIARSMVINGREVLTTLATKFEDGEESHVSFDFFQVGQFVEVKANEHDGGAIIAVAIEIDDEGEVENEFEFKGIIESIDVTSGTLIVNGTTVIINGSTRLLNRFNLPVEFAVFEVGQLVEVEGNRQGDDSVLARKVKLEDLEDDELPIDEVAVRGTISAIDTIGGSLVVEGQTINVTPSTRLLGLQNQVVDFTHFQVGQLVEVEGVPVADSDAINATKIKREDGPAGGRLLVRGTIVRPVGSLGFKIASTTTLRIGSWDVLVTPSTTLTDRFGQAITVADLTLGDYVVLSGSASGPLTLNAATLDREDQFFLVSIPQNAVSPSTWMMFE